MPTTKPNSEHFVLQRSGWLLLLLVTRLSATMFYECACSTFLIPDLENSPPSSQSHARDRRCESCRKRSKKRNRRWERRAREKGLVTRWGVFMWRDGERKERVKVLVKEAVLGGMVAVGCVGLWRLRGVWGWWGLSVGFGLWGGLGMGGFSDSWDDDGDDGD
ncbi:hypothetical protein SBOR_4282 [Sclerotinia borealis F-4128]|uniref:Transmembrane protein n=1 Tax=Sclerotinia borealis (strain F-4128) TaxID=1432307 RepID=W9CHE3_SCLBF|nr:hypothetical protein SBOR_4282 [Sclerotinia borealis F-4128]